MKLIFEGKNKYRVWYRPYSYPDEEDFIDVTADTEEEAVEFARTLGYETEVELKNSITEDVEKRDIMDLSTSERVDLMLNTWRDRKFSGDYSTESFMRYWEGKGWDTSRYTSEEFDRVWDLAQDELDVHGYVDDEDEYEEEIETREDAYYWLQSKLAEYGNTYHFPQEERIKLDRLIDKFGNTYFWGR